MEEDIIFITENIKDCSNLSDLYGFGLLLGARFKEFSFIYGNSIGINIKLSLYLKSHEGQLCISLISNETNKSKIICIINTNEEDAVHYGYEFLFNGIHNKPRYMVKSARK